VAVTPAAMTRWDGCTGLKGEKCLLMKVERAFRRVGLP
jgi:hypothetical protein